MWLPLLALAVPAVLLVTAWSAPRRAGGASGLALGMAGAFTLAVMLTRGSPRGPASWGVSLDGVSCLMLLLVTSLGAATVRYSKTYLQGEAGLSRYLRWLLLTLAAGSTLVISSNLLVLSLAWTATSLALHQLLIFYRDRAPALAAAHKKFLVSRLADCCLFLTLILVHREAGTFELDRLAAWVSSHPELPGTMQLAALLVAVAVVLRSAQLPFHGWLIQVMEAPTPVSALLHAGVVNIGGFVLIRLAPLMGHARAAQLFLVSVGLGSALIAALVMVTRVSVKVSLAWSTCAQMGFMLAQCGLGLWPLALLHLIAHSLYKAHAFLSAGSAVASWKVVALRQSRRVSAWVEGLVVSLAAALGLMVGSRRPLSAAVTALLLALSIVPLLTQSAAHARARAQMLAGAAGVALLYLAVHAVAMALAPREAVLASPVAWTLVALAIVTLFATKAALQLRPNGALARTLHPWLFAGLYLDELFTRVAFRCWPPRLRAGSTVPSEAQFAKTVGARA